jgi:hypothetical protein
LTNRLGVRANALVARARLSSRSAVERRLVWILGSPRTGSTWLMNLLAVDRRVVKVDEPTVGLHVGALMLDWVSVRPRRIPVEQMRVNDVRAELPSYFFSRPYERTWRPGLRKLVIDRFRAEILDHARAAAIADPLAVIKEPIGSQGADILMSLLPRSRLIFLLRDGRDVIDSELDAFREGGWVAEMLPGFETAEQDRLSFVNSRAQAWLCRTAAVQRAFDAHSPELRRTVRYEDLLSDPESMIASLVEWLGLSADADRVREVVARMGFDRVDPAERGRGKFARAAKPGLWRENLTAEEQRLIEDLIGPNLRELGYG